MPTESNSSQPETPASIAEHNLQSDDSDGAVDNSQISERFVAQQALTALVSQQAAQNPSALQQALASSQHHPIYTSTVKPRALFLILVAIATTITGIALNNPIVGIVGTLMSFLLSFAVLLPWLQFLLDKWFSSVERVIIICLLGLIVSVVGLVKFSGFADEILGLGGKIDWQAFGTLADWFGALGQILIAIIAVYVAWRQYIISKDLTIQQNLLTIQQNIITQQQTIDSYFQGISDLVLDEEGLLEDWPQERAIAEGRTAAILSSVDGNGKAKIIRFLSRSKLLTPLKRDRHLGRAILDGVGGYAEDRLEGLRVIDLGVMLAGADLASTDLRWTDLSEVNLVRANLSNCDLVKANLSRTILYEATLIGADLNSIRLFYGSPEVASPRSRTEQPNYQTGEYTGAVVENANFTNVKRLSASARYYCCAWGGEKTRGTIPEGCEGIPNKLGR